MDFNNNRDDQDSSSEPAGSREELKTSPSKFEIGGPMSAFSSLYSKPTVYETKQLGGIYSTETPEKLGNHILQTNLFNSGGGIFQDIPVAPAFAQIFNRRRRRENRPRRQRTTFTSEQTLKLELEYNRADYITRPRRYELAEVLSLTESQIKIWFQNRRAKDKRIEKAHMDHQLRAMGISHFHGQLPFSMPSLCGACVPSPVPLPFPQPPFPTVQNKTFKIL